MNIFSYIARDSNVFKCCVFKTQKKVREYKENSITRFSLLISLLAALFIRCNCMYR
ncbi:hypothetical protein B4U79_02416 [Dinothrombium tinctorium]|uniref:Uncharacterized protein n=1 Tax=Dinothrombium tinctorium TaxID=1965070 RepID=A0A3S3P5H8_9ACAR|nr:hypothetical protein B4U79_11062 [Dinothrombium tinctorium]RWS05608.1 hypothetical protein B4U79_02416 [Dinothrombium tinctorium]